MRPLLEGPVHIFKRVSEKSQRRIESFPSNLLLPRSFPGKINFRGVGFIPSLLLNSLAACCCCSFASSLIVDDVERGRDGDRSTVLRGAEPVSGGDCAAERNLWRSDGCSDPSNVLPGHSCSFQLPLLRQYWSHPYQVNISFSLIRFSRV